MDTLTEFLKLATAPVLLAVAVLKLRSTSEADGPGDQEDEQGRDVPRTESRPEKLERRGPARPDGLHRLPSLYPYGRGRQT